MYRVRCADPVVTECTAEESGFDILQGQGILISKASRQAVGPTHVFLCLSGDVCLVLKRSEREAYCQVKNEWYCMSVWLHGVQRNTVLFIWNGTAIPLVVKPVTSTVVTELFNFRAHGTTNPSAEPPSVFYVTLLFLTKICISKPRLSLHGAKISSSGGVPGSDVIAGNANRIECCPAFCCNCANED